MQPGPCCASVIIPAHNEAAVIGRCLWSILAGAAPGELEIIVVCNGCSDDTASIARRFGDPVTVIETPVASKAVALNLGDSAATRFPRFYVDADVVVTLDALRQVTHALATTGALAAAPRIHVDLSARNWWVRAYYNIWVRLPYCTQGMIGSGVYALSERGRSRFSQFPVIIADDEFVRLQFAGDERLCVRECIFSITPPTSLMRIIGIKTRSYCGRYELRTKLPRCRESDGRNYRPFLRELIISPQLWAPFLVYVMVLYACRLRGWWRFVRGGTGVWDRDETSRRSEASTRSELEV